MFRIHTITEGKRLEFTAEFYVQVASIQGKEVQLIVRLAPGQNIELNGDPLQCDSITESRRVQLKLTAGSVITIRENHHIIIHRVCGNEAKIVEVYPVYARPAQVEVVPL
jgi:hypothetical protein